MRIISIVSLVFGVSIGAAQADLIDPAQAACSQKAKGAACTAESGGQGTCQTARCCRNDYSKGTPPGTICSDCLKCMTSAARPAKPLPTKTAQPARTPVEAVPAQPVLPKRASADQSTSSEAPKPDMGKTDGCAAVVDVGGEWGLGSFLVGVLLLIRLRRSGPPRG